MSFFTAAHALKLVENAGCDLVRLETSTGPVNPVLGAPATGRDRLRDQRQIQISHIRKRGGQLVAEKFPMQCEDGDKI